MPKLTRTNALVLTVAAISLFAAAMSAADEPQNANLPLKRVVLFNSGVGFFEHSGKIDGNANVEMKFKTDQINDLLKRIKGGAHYANAVDEEFYVSVQIFEKMLNEYAKDKILFRRNSFITH